MFTVTNWYVNGSGKHIGCGVRMYHGTMVSLINLTGLKTCTTLAGLCSSANWIDTRSQKYLAPSLPLAPHSFSHSSSFFLLPQLPQMTFFRSL